MPESMISGSFEAKNAVADHPASTALGSMLDATAVTCDRVTLNVGYSLSTYSVTTPKLPGPPYRYISDGGQTLGESTYSTNGPEDISVLVVVCHYCAALWQSDFHL
jgi:hypothetical protein